MELVDAFEMIAEFVNEIVNKEQKLYGYAKIVWSEDKIALLELKQKHKEKKKSKIET